MLLWKQIEILFLLQTLENYAYIQLSLEGYFRVSPCGVLILTGRLPVFRFLRSLQTDPRSAGRDQKWRVCCAWWSDSFQRGQLCHLSSTSPPRPPCLHPPSHLGLPQWQDENFLSLDKSLPQLKFFSAAVSSCSSRWNLSMKWIYWSYQCTMAKLAQTKAICLYSLGNSESSLIMLWLELISGPCLSFSPWQFETMYCRSFRIPDTYSSAGYW